ncbi:hypothetical protein V8C34DRAFT_300206 [Trichoderma compactum]
MFRALAHRYQTAMSAKDEGVIVFDRGINMFKAVAVGVIAMKDQDEDLSRTRRILDSILDSHDLHPPSESMAFLLKHGNTLDDSVQLTMKREANPNDKRYGRYQRLLQTELWRQELAGVYQHTIHATATDSIRGIQDQIRKVLLEQTANPLFQPTMQNLAGIYAFVRANIAYFNGRASETIGRSVHDLPEKEQALYLFHELDRFQRSHYRLRLLTIESLHRDSVTQYLKSWLGEKLQIVFIDTNESQRRERSLVSQEECNSGLQRHF